MGVAGIATAGSAWGVSPARQRAYNPVMELNGAKALVTGAARRIGRAIALALAEAGADVMVHYNRSRSQAESAAEAIEALGVRGETVQADLADPDAIEAMFRAVAGAFGRLDVLVNNAAVFAPTPLADLTAEQWDAPFAVNARAAALCIRHAMPLMPRGAAIVNVTDISAEKPWAAYPAYCASKAALLSLTKSAARALAGRGIRVNAVAPGAVAWHEGASDAHKQAVLAQVPLKRPGSAADVAAAAVFLARNDYITGQSLRVDGGWLMA